MRCAHPVRGQHEPPRAEKIARAAGHEPLKADNPREAENLRRRRNLSISPSPA